MKSGLDRTVQTGFFLASPGEVSGINGIFQINGITFWDGDHSFMNCVRILLGIVAALAVSVVVQICVILIETIPYHFGIDMGSWPLGEQHWLIYSSETIVAICGILAAGYVTVPAHRAVSCWIITVVCLGISLYLMHMVGKGHNLPNPGWSYYLRDPILLCFALGGAATSLFFSLRPNKKAAQKVALQQPIGNRP